MKPLRKYRVFIMVGYPGSGKSTLARKMAVVLPAHYLSSDEVREKMFQSSRYDPVGDRVISKQRDGVYQFMAATILSKLGSHDKIIMDATNLETAKREIIINSLLTRLSAEQICFITVKTPRQVIRERMRQLDANIEHIEEARTETLLAGWERVYAIFKQKQKQGLISWPKQGKIQVIKAQKIYDYLA
jgi:predicted kinase